jgi:UDP-glucuronate decarboxylase
MNKTILVTGGRGFIGANLCNRLASEGNRVIAVDNMFCASPLQMHSEVECCELDVTNEDFDRSFMTLYKHVDQIYHLASIASPKWYKKYALFTIETNVIGTMVACKLAAYYNAKLLLSSTSEVYGDPEVHPQPEEYNGNVNTLSDRACYDESKRCAETIVGAHSHLIDATIVRIFNTYGPGMRVDDGRAVSEFICRMLKDKPLTLTNFGLQTRSFCYVDDMVEYLVRAMALGKLGPYNVGSFDEITISELSLRIADLRGVYLPETNPPIVDKNDPRKRRPDLSRAYAAFGYHPQVGLSEGLSRTVEYFRGII